jgi:TrmH family RNA methyltransferase
VLAVISNPSTSLRTSLQSSVFNNLRLKTEDLFLICDRISDPGNLGALLRSAAAAGAAAVWLAPGTADAFNPKVVRAGMGAHFRLPLELLEWDTISARLAGWQILLADTEEAIHDSPDAKRQTIRYDLADWTQPSAVIVSNEAEGPSPAARACATASVFIPMPGGSESLNAAIAGSVILFEAVRQRLVKRQT